jgi:hypothetical protein
VHVTIYIKANVCLFVSLCLARQWPVNNNEVVFSFGSVLRLYKGGRGPESDSCSEGTRQGRDGRQPARKRRKSAVIRFHNGSKKAEIYWTSQPELQRDEVVKSRPT